MRSLRCVFALPLFLIAFATSALAQQQNLTDAQRDDLAGPVKSVSSSVMYPGVSWQQPGGPTLVAPISCRDCEYDPDGIKTKSGQVVDGNFLGEIIQLVRDANGHVTDRFVENASTDELVRHEVVGPFGKAEQTIYQAGELYWRQTYSYDKYGHVTDWLTFDSTGKQISRTLTSTDKDGTVKETSVWGKDGELDWMQTFDPQTQVEQFTTFDRFGATNLTWTVASGKLISFWERPHSPSQFGDNFTEDAGNDTFENYNCHNDGRCDLSRVHYVYLDPKRHDPQSAEWRDSQGNLCFAAYYDYKIDSFRNWTYRRVWVWTPALGERTLYETDSRAISYWKK
jgi:hypothetical protein